MIKAQIGINYKYCLLIRQRRGRTQQLREITVKTRLTTALYGNNIRNTK